MKISQARRPPGAEISITRSPSITAPRSRKASRCGSSRRRPIVSPPGGGIATLPKRASSGPASRNEARICAATSSSSSVESIESACSLRSWALSHSVLTPIPSSRLICASASRIRGMLRRITSSSVSRQAASSGRAAFLFPAVTISPESSAPPWITNFSKARLG